MANRPLSVDPHYLSRSAIKLIESRPTAITRSQARINPDDILKPLENTCPLDAKTKIPGFDVPETSELDVRQRQTWIDIDTLEPSKTQVRIHETKSKIRRIRYTLPIFRMMATYTSNTAHLDGLSIHVLKVVRCGQKNPPPNSNRSTTTRIEEMRRKIL